MVAYTTDFSLAKVRKKLVLESPHFRMEYIVQVQIPIKFLHLAHSMIPLNDVEDSLYLSLSVSIVLLGGLLLFLSFQSMRRHITYEKDMFEVNQKRHIL